MLLLQPFLQSGFLCQFPPETKTWHFSSSPINKFPLISQPTKPVTDLKVLLSSATSNWIVILDTNWRR
ncbi:hypothetical protein ES332_D12G173100v1 [Gossypium tomentosum]|uniref:Uncharacterized protein n=1 Tax=Gossypium tomentosum TaxID=34277 RepID=A0A5D2IAB2_GOSTO|nr:hypothetical protein ES332_D12G173100v1 [Gossypium tomentosum]TYH39337.1 hypothetical protein ES332_D12G173100v1 [Gossypium tomentosum]TYH39338.1 hypothetical protein ES332_D12G173100v1 [Gossypium tomentosum]TYH39341.1 hypothetical protein ES332_D12G173100v1 [Gossypium tomentosum]